MIRVNVPNRKKIMHIDKMYSNHPRCLLEKALLSKRPCQMRIMRKHGGRWEYIVHYTIDENTGEIESCSDYKILSNRWKDNFNFTFNTSLSKTLVDQNKCLTTMINFDSIILTGQIL